MATDKYEPSKHPQPSSDSENITDKEDDVKVCDICGDAGQEDSLAICSRCSDGAEHIYCMETMLDELPDGDWLCEECKFKEEYENQTVHKLEEVTKTQEQSYLDEDAQHGLSTIYSKAPSKKDGSVIKGDILGTRTLEIREIPFMRHGENVDFDTVPCDKASKTSFISAETSVHQDVSLLSTEEILTNPDSATKKPSNLEQSNGNCPILKGQNTQTSSGLISSASRDGFKVISGTLKPSSFKNTNAKSKVKQILGATPLTENATGKLFSKNTRNGELTGGMVKSTSFKTEKGVCNGFELLNEKQSVKLNKMKHSNVERNNESGVIERENPSAIFYQVMDRELIDGDISGCNRENPLRSSRSSISASSNGLNLQFQKQGQISQPNNHLMMESAHQDDIAKVSVFYTPSNKPTSCGSGIIQCKICNETGHPTHLCSITKHCISAIKLSADRMPWENANRSNKWKAAKETIMSKQEALKCTNTTNQSTKLFIPTSGHSAEVVNKVLPPHCFRRTYSLEGRTNDRSIFDNREPTVHLHVANQTEIHHEAGADRLNSFGNISKEFNVKHSEQVLPSIDPDLSNAQRTSVIPKLEFFWQGGFEVLRAGRLSECCDGLQAHFSSYASGKVFEAAKKFPPYKVQLEEVSCISSWPQHFHGNHAKEQNIAIFFFAKDIESYRSNYCKLLEKMLKFDLALKGNLGGFELLIFPSNKLSENSQCSLAHYLGWNRLLFLWGTFKGRSSGCSEVLPNGKQDPFKSTMDVKLLTTLPEASNYQETNTIQNSYEANKYVSHVDVSPGLST